MEKLNKLAKEIVENLVACDSAEPEAVDQYEAWTQKRLKKAFRAMEQRAEAAEASAKDWRNKAMTQCAKREVAESKLAELEKQAPYGTLINTFLATDPRAIAEARKRGMPTVEVFTRAAPAINLEELVPDEKSILAEAGGYGSIMSLEQKSLFVEGGRWVRAAILRNIDESGIAASLAHIGFDPSGGDEATVIVHHVAPAGWKLVPAEPSWEMISAAIKHHEGDAFLPVSLYKTMLAAAPEVE